MNLKKEEEMVGGGGEMGRGNWLPYLLKLMVSILSCGHRQVGK